MPFTMEQIPKLHGPEASPPRTESESSFSYSTITSPNSKSIPPYRRTSIGPSQYTPGVRNLPNNQVSAIPRLLESPNTTPFPGTSSFSIQNNKMSLTATATATSALPCPPPRLKAHARSQSQSSGSFAPKASVRTPTTPPASISSKEPVSSISSGQAQPGKKRDRPCDACRRRKSRCVLHEGQTSCVLCQFHSQDCTFVQSPQPRSKRRLPASSELKNGAEENVSKKRIRDSNSPATKDQPASHREPVTVEVPADYAQLRGPTLLRKTLGLEIGRHSRYVGPTSEYEECLVDLCPLDSEDEYGLAHGGHFRRLGNGVTFLMYADQAASEIAVLDEIEAVVAPHGPTLVDLYFRIVHPSFPILHKRVFYEKYNRTYREFSPPLLAAVYALALGWWSYDADLQASGAQKPDVAALDQLGTKALADVMARPKLSTVQAGLLLLQRQIPGFWTTTAQLVAVGHELGLYLDPSGWKIPDWEKGLRKRLAWALFMQDKWGALTHGRPSLIQSSNWGVPFPTAADFPDFPEDNESDLDGSAETLKGREHFTQMISLTAITSDILSAFFTLESDSRLSRISQVLEFAKPMQIRLRDWYAHLPESLKMDAPAKPKTLSPTGSLHLAYFTTEITLHRRILRTLHAPGTVDPYLHHICRSAAKTRLISALDFVNRLKPQHLQAFWPATAGKNFALIGTFGALLWATSQTGQEAEFYRARLMEYRWTLRVSARGAEWMEVAVGVLDAGVGKEQWERWKERGGRIEPVAEGLGVGLLGFGSAIDTTPVPAPRRPPPPVRPTLASAKLSVDTGSAELSGASDSEFDEDEEMMDDDGEDGTSGPIDSHGSGTPVDSGSEVHEHPQKGRGIPRNYPEYMETSGTGGGQRAGYILMPSGIDDVGAGGNNTVGRRESIEIGKWQSGGAIG